MPSTLELLKAPEIYLLRQGPNHFRYGDEWNISGVIEKTGDSVIIKGACNLLLDGDRPGHKLDIASIRAELRKLGVTSVRWERSEEGVFVPHALTV